MKKKLLMYAHYFHPDVASTGQILKELAEGMLEEFEITVICAVPSYTGVISPEYKEKNFYFEEINGVKVVRVKVPEFSKTNKISRIKNIVTYFLKSIFATFKVEKQDYIFSISQPPILGGLLGVCGKWIKKAKYIYNIQDFNPEQTIAVKYSKNKIILKLMLVLDKFSCKQADKVIVVGRDMIETLENRFKLSDGSSGKKTPKYSCINNWSNEEELYPLNSDNEGVVAFKKKYCLENKFVIMYSGNIGLYYDLENLIKIIVKFKNEKDVIFAFVGEGTVLRNLKKYKEMESLANVTFIPYQDKTDLIYSLNAGDVHWVVNAKGIKGISVPSKLYGVMATGKPVLGVLDKGSEARLIIEESDCGYVTEPGNYEEVENIIRRFINERGTTKQVEASNNGRKYLVNHLTKQISIKKYIEAIRSLDGETIVERKSIYEQ